MRTLAIPCACLLVLSACAGTKEAPPAPPREEAAAREPPPFSTAETVHRMTLLHSSDNESDLLGAGRGDGEKPRGGLGRAVALVRALEAAAKEPVLVLAAGDTMMPAPELQLIVNKTNAVAHANNLIGYHASALGNHEWDLGEGFLAEYLTDAAFPYLSASMRVNGGTLGERWLEPRPGEPAPWAHEIPGRLTPRARACVRANDAPAKAAGAEDGGAFTCDGLVVGLIGATTELLRGISNVPDHVELASSLDDVRARVQKQADLFKSEGVGVVVLTSHLQDVRKELRLVADGLVGVDIIVAGGGDNRLANDGDRLLPRDEPDHVCAPEPKDCYPLVRKAKDGRPVLIVATDGQMRYLGALSVGFDAEGVLTGFSPTSRPWPVDEASLVELRAEPAKDGIAFVQEINKQLAPMMSPFAQTAVYLEGTRESVRNRQTNLGDLSADSMAWAARQNMPKGVRSVAFAARNGGGIRAPIGSIDRETYEKGGGPLRPLDVKGALRFDGPIVVVTTTHEVVLRTFESALRGAGMGKGQFPQVSGDVWLEYSQAAPEQQHVLGRDGRPKGVTCPGQRVRNLRVTPAGGEPIDIVVDGKVNKPKAKISFATLAYLARGGDGWFPGDAKKLRVAPVKREGGDATEQWAFTRYVEDLLAHKRWDDGRAYVDPTAGQADTFTRIRVVDSAPAPSPACTAP